MRDILLGSCSTGFGRGVRLETRTSDSSLAFFSPPSGREEYVMATLAPISAQPRAASMPIPLGPEAPVTITTFPLRLKSSRRESALGMLIMMTVVQGLVVEW